jgi:phage RecT family recombinase
VTNEQKTIDEIMAESTPIDRDSPQGSQEPPKAPEAPEGSGDLKRAEAPDTGSSGPQTKPEPPSAPDNRPRALRVFDDQADAVRAACTGITYAQLRATVAHILITRNEIRTCTIDSIMDSAIACAKLGVDPTGRRNSAHFINRKGVCCLQLGYGALVTLAKRHGDVLGVDVVCVYKGDTFEIKQGTTREVIHVPKITEASRREDCIACYAIAHYPGGFYKFDWMSVEEIRHIRDKYAKGTDKASSPWKAEFNEQCKKTMVHRLFKMIDLSPQAAEAIEHIEVTDFNVGRPAFDPSRMETSRAALAAGETNERIVSTQEPVEVEQS